MLKFENTVFKRERQIGEHKILLPEPPEIIDNHDLPKKDQKFNAYVDQRKFNTLDVHEQKEIIKREFSRRLYGYWFYKNGNIEYITGTHYFYLTAWNMDTGLPWFTDADRDFFYLWDEVVKSKTCYGLLFICDRRSGKTYKGGCLLYEPISRTKEAHAGIQSKTYNDAKKIVFNKIIAAWRDLPDYYKPTDSGEKHPKNSLRFEEPGTRSTKKQKKRYTEVLNSSIGYESSGEEAYDGSKFLRLFHDEIGKKTDADVEKRWYICKPCLEDGGIVGKAYLSTTVEEQDKEGGDRVEQLWKDSDITNVKADGTTISGLWRYFKPAYYGKKEFIDEYGYTVIDDPVKPVKAKGGHMIYEGSKTYILKRRDKLTGAKLNSEVRKNPMDIHEAFTKDQSQEIFPIFKIDEQKRYNEGLLNGTIRRGNFIISDTDTYQSEFYDDPEGRWQLTWLPEIKNNKDNKNGVIIPGNKGFLTMGVDPYDHRTTVDNRKSDAAAYIFMSFDIRYIYQSNNFIAQYIHRVEPPSLMYKDLIAAAVYFGCDILIENQKPGLINEMYNLGYNGYIMRTRQSDYTKSNTRTVVDGISMSGEIVREAAISTYSEYLYNFCGKISKKVQQEKMGIPEDKFDELMYGRMYFDEQLDDARKFNVKKWTDYDATVAAMITLLGAKRKRIILKEEEPEIKNLSSLIPKSIRSSRH